MRWKQGRRSTNIDDRRGRRVSRPVAVGGGGLGLLAIGGGSNRSTANADEPGGLPVADAQRSEPVRFEKEIAPLLKRNCVACHNPHDPREDVK